MDAVRILGAAFIVVAISFWAGYAFGAAREQERQAMRALRRHRDDRRVTIGGYPAGPRLVSELDLPVPTAALDEWDRRGAR